MICNESWKIHDASLITEINNKSFEINDLKAQLQEKSIVVNELKQLLAKLKGNSQVTLCETPDFDSRIESEPINAYFKNNRVVHQDNLKVTKEQIETLQELLEQTRSLKPLDENLDYASSGCSKHMTGQRDTLINFVSKFISTVRFGNDHFVAIMGYGDLQLGNILISKWSDGDNDLTMPQSFGKRMSKSAKPDSRFYNSNFYYLVYLSMEKKYTSSLTKHYAARYYIEGIQDMISNRWIKEVHLYHVDALNGIYRILEIITQSND
ncbi:hypothetical protein Tco_0396244 [Tanacetum coccineum]